MGVCGVPAPAGPTAGGFEEILLDLLAELVPATGADPDDSLAGLPAAAARLPAVSGAGTMWNRDARLRHIAATDPVLTRLQLIQEEEMAGPSVDAFRLNAVTTTSDLAGTAARWPGAAHQARSLCIGAFAALPLASGGVAVGTLSVWRRPPGEWSPLDLQILDTLGEIVTSEVIRNSEYQLLARTTRDLRHALDSRVLIEQAKGVLAGRKEIGMDRALALMRRHARDRGVTLRSVAADVVAGRLRL